MRVSILRSATCAAVLLACMSSTSAPAQRRAARPEPRICTEGELRAQQPAGGPQRLTTKGGRISLVPPEGLRVLSPMEVRASLGDDYHLAMVDDGEAAAMMISFRDRPPPADVQAHREWVETRPRTSSSGETLVASEVMELGGVRWLRLELTGPPDGIGHKMLYLTSFQGRGLLVTLLAFKPERMPELVKSVATLEVHDCALPPMPLTAFLDSAALVRAVSTLPVPDLPRGVKPLFKVAFDSTGAVDEVTPVFDQIPASFAGPVVAAIRANLKNQSPSREPIHAHVRVVAGPEPLVDRPRIVVREPVLANEGGIRDRIGQLSARFGDRVGGAAIAQPRAGFLRRLLMGSRPSWSARFFVRMRVLKDGAVDTGSIEILHSSSRDEEVNDAVADLVGQMRFRPATVEGIPASVWVTLPIILQY